MNEQVARRVVLVRAIESADTGHQVLSEDDRKYASRSARELAAWQAADSKAAATQEHFLEQRSEQIIKRLSERTPAFASFQRRGLGLPGFWAALPVFALVAGALLDRIADPHRVDLLSAPLLLIIGWNLLVYLVLLVWALIPGRKTGWAGQGLLSRLSVGKAALPRKLPGALSTGMTNFMAEWAVLSEPLTRARLSRTVHLSAAAFALGAVLSLYARGMLTQYVAGWESTFLDAQQVHTLLSWLFAPVLLLFPFLQGFSLADIESLRFSTNTAIAGTSGAGGERWVHLYGATILLPPCGELRPAAAEADGLPRHLQPTDLERLGWTALVLELRESVTGEILVRAVDSRSGRGGATWTVSNRATNTGGISLKLGPQLIAFRPGG